ncbi:peptide chain release factor N(5)-glutamine methyltransferase [Neptunicoccus cionae]|uniref:Release factor glutamine methyltransferase n=1 Tax=Neptunicoccus cionae TaxID=2035344 RepID=A0A916R027_9RHOB|nr:peptide chain release factor N(5)-glutamine methyltransferase [Amylibacter cionae]GGA24789.1 release factor glutamine methyltransferase [Amylibacter cionae]
MIQTASMVLRSGTRLLNGAIGEGASRDARILMAHMLGVETDRLTLELSRTITPTQVSHFEHMIKRRAAHEPVSHIIGKRAFWKHDFKVTADVLDPRPDTETLIELALQGTAPRRILDLGTGSGCILLSLLAEFPDAVGLGTDMSEKALEVAQENANTLGLTERASFATADWFNGLEGAFDLIVSNPPYITAAEMNELSSDVRDYEPHMALTPGGDGLSAYRIIAEGLAGFKAPEGRALFEIGYKQGPDVTAIFKDAGFKEVNLHKDLAGHDRIVAVS